MPFTAEGEGHADHAPLLHGDTRAVRVMPDEMAETPMAHRDLRRAALSEASLVLGAVREGEGGGLVGLGHVLMREGPDHGAILAGGLTGRRGGEVRP